MIDKIKISVIIPIYNVEQYIVECAKSLFEQDINGLEYIFVNDCTPDNSIEELENIIDESYKNIKHNINIINLEKNGGIANARNIGIENAHGDYIAFCDSDDWIDTTMLSTLYNVAITKNADVVGCNFINEYEDKCVVFKQKYSHDKSINIGRLIVGDIFPSLCTEIVRRNLYIENNIRFHSGINMGEDLLVNVQLFVYSNTIIGIKDALYHYRHYKNSSCVIRNRSAIDSDIKVASLIYDFLLSKNLDLIYKKEILYRKFISKSTLWRSRPVRDYYTWLNTYPESNKYIFSYSQLDMKMKIEYWLASIGLVELADSFVDLLHFQKKIRYWFVKSLYK